MKIQVHDKTFYYSGQPITVYATNPDDDEDILYCNHEGADSMEVDFGYPDAIIGDWVDNIKWVMQCDKCGATYNQYDNYWEDAPQDGIR